MILDVIFEESNQVIDCRFDETIIIGNFDDGYDKGYEDGYEDW